MGSGTSSISRSSEASIVIVGAGYGGTAVGRKLKSTGKIKIINPRDFLFHNIGALRATVEPEFAKNLPIPLKNTFGDSFVLGKVTQINKERNTVTLEGGEEIKYSHLILATGASSSFPAKLSNDYQEASEEDITKLYLDINDKIKEAKSVVCVGGGPVGVELAGEIKTDYPEKQVTLIHSSEKLASARLSSKVQKSLKKALTKCGIELVLGEKVSNLEDLELNNVKDQTVKTDAGNEITCDLVLRCTGGKPNTDHFKSALGDAIDHRGQIKVNPYLQVEGFENIFALGDIVDTDEEKTSVAASAQATIVAKNIVASMSGGKMKAYKPSTFLMIIPVGRNGGVGQLPIMTIGGALTRNIKSTSLFKDKFWGDMGQKPPK